MYNIYVKNYIIFNRINNSYQYLGNYEFFIIWTIIILILQTRMFDRVTYSLICFFQIIKK